MEWFGLESQKKIPLKAHFVPPPGTPSTIPGCSDPLSNNFFPLQTESKSLPCPPNTLDAPLLVSYTNLGSAQQFHGSQRGSTIPAWLSEAQIPLPTYGMGTFGISSVADIWKKTPSTAQRHKLQSHF